MSQQNTPRAIVVLGMHRSGTSALTRVVNSLGADLGPNLIQAVPDENDLGFWEPREIVDIHDRLLETLGSRWDDTLPLPAEWWLNQEVLAYRSQLIAILKKQFSGVPFWAIKDPRLCRLLPLWKSIFSELRCEVSYLIIGRNPHEVADSLAQRNGIALEDSYHLWLDSVLESIHHTQGLPRAFVTYDRLLNDWRGTLRKAARTLDIKWPRSITNAQHDVARFLDATFRNHFSSADLVKRDPAIPVWLPEVYSALRKAAADGETSQLQRVFARSRKEMLSALRMQGPELERSRANLLEAQQQTARADSNAEALEAEVEAERERLRSSAAKLESTHSALTTLRLKFKAAAREATQLRSELTLKQSEAARQDAVVEKLGAEHEQTRAKLTITGEKLAQSHAKLEATQYETGNLQTQLHEKISKFEETRSWLDHTRANLRERTAYAEQVDIERDASAAETVRLQEQLDATGENLLEMRSELEGTRTELQAATEESLHLQEQLRQAEGDLSLADAAIESVRNELSQARRDFKDRQILQEHQRKALLDKVLRAQNRLRARALESASLHQRLETEKQERDLERKATEIRNAKAAADAANDLLASHTEVSRLSQHLSDRDANLACVQTELDDQTREHTRIAEEQMRERTRMAEDAVRLQEELGAMATEVQRLSQSRSWRYTLPVRTSATWLRSTVKSTRDWIVPVVPEFHFPKTKHPRVSIVIPAYNHFDETYACLVAIRDHTSAIEYEVIIVDDHSEDEHREIERHVANARVLHNPENLGFVGSCNRGAKVARGEYLVFLNNDTLVGEGWLPALIDTFDQHPDAGLVGAKLIYPDGRLQEAGGIIWSDGAGWNYGRLADPEKPEYNYVREVDYCSGACIAIARHFFFDLGMFDTLYAPAYYEDTDLAFAVRAAGRRVLYQPAAEVVHLEGVTAGNDTTSGVKQFQVVNQKKFHRKWSDALQQQPLHVDRPDLAKDHGSKRRVLVIDSYTPMPDRDSGSVRMHQILKILTGLDSQVTFIPDNLAHAADYTRSLQGMGVEALYHPHILSIQDHLSEHGARYDVVIISRVDVAKKHIESVHRFCPNAKLAFDTVDLHFVREARQQEVRGGEIGEGATARKREELGVAAEADVTIVVSPAEKEMLSQQAPELTVEVVSNIHRSHLTTNRFKARSGILFIGSFEHSPNADAVGFYLREVHPLVRKKLPDVDFSVIGSDPPDHLRRLAGEGVHFLGHVENIRELFAAARLSVAPLRFGAGVKGKINSSMSFGVPVVTTGIGAEGMDLQHGEHAMMADDPEAFAEAVVEVYTSKRLWSKLVRGGIENLESRFSIKQARDSLARVIDTNRALSFYS